MQGAYMKIYRVAHRGELRSGKGDLSARPRWKERGGHLQPLPAQAQEALAQATAYQCRRCLSYASMKNVLEERTRENKPKTLRRASVGKIARPMICSKCVVVASSTVIMPITRTP